MIYTYAQNLGIQSRELARVGFVRRDLACSDGCPGFGEKYQDDVLAQVITQLDVLVQVGWQCKIGGCLPNISLHLVILLSGEQFYLI